MGYKQELKRNFSTLEVFGISFSIIAVLPSIASTLSYSIPAGPAGMVWVFICLYNDRAQYLANRCKGLVHSWRLHFTCWNCNGSIASSNNPRPVDGELTLLQGELASAMPTSGGLYWWTHFFASVKTRKPLCFLVGYSNTLGLVGCLCSVDCAFCVIIDWPLSNRL